MHMKPGKIIDPNLLQCCALHMFPKLEEINLQAKHDFLIAMQDYAEGDCETFRRHYIRSNQWNEAEFRIFVKECEKQRMDWRPSAKCISTTHYILREHDGRVCGIGRMRFPLNAEQQPDRGNLEFDVPPSLRRQDYGTLVLNRMLFEAVRAGLARALVVCTSKNIAAVKIIEKNRGILESSITPSPDIEQTERDELLRFWIKLR